MTLWQLFIFFFRISSVTFGGGIVILGMVQLEQERRKDIDPEEFADMVKMQRSYQAAAKTLSVMDQSLQDLIGIIR